MASPPLLWLDFRQHPHGAGSFSLLNPSWSSTRIVRPQDPALAIRECQPRFLAFELDEPSASDLAALQASRQEHPGLPILVLSDEVSPAFTEWMFRLGIWDYLVSPVNAVELNACIEAFSNFCRQRHLGTLQEKIPCKPPRQPRTQAACDYVAHHYASEVRLVTAASLCCLSESEFSRCFKKENGITFSEYLMNWRMQRARDLLTDPTTQVKNVAFEVGFNDVSYFARAFRHHTGITPSLYQRKSGFAYHATVALTSATEALRPPV